MKLRTRIFPESLAIAWLVANTAAYLAPAFAHGRSLGPFDLLSGYGLSYRPGVVAHNIVGADEIQELIPWQALDWLQVHAGHLPLWNPYSALGVPLAFNMQSSPFSLSVAIGYLFPLHLAHSATVLARLLIAGTGTYVFCRALKMSILAAVTSATIYEFCGGFSIWLGSNISDEMAWTGWVLAASVLVMKGKHRTRNVAGLALTLALALYAGEPQITAVLFASLVIFVVITQVHRYRKSDRRAARACAIDHAAAVFVAFGLAAPLYLPALQLGPGSARAVYPPIAGLPLYDLTHFLFATYNGSPIAGSQVIGPNNLYVSMLYVGVIGVVLAGVGILSAWRKQEVVALAFTAGILLIVVFCRPIISLLSRVPDAKVFRVLVATVFVEFAIAILAGFGIDALLRVRSDRSVLRQLGLMIGFVGMCIAALGLRLILNSSHLSVAAESTRWHSFIWPAAQFGACFTVFIGLLLTSDRSFKRRFAQFSVGLALLVEATFLVSVGNSIWSSSNAFFVPTKAVTELQHDVGTSLVGMGVCPSVNAFSGLGIMPNANIVYGVDQLEVYDPIIPAAYFASYATATREREPITSPGIFCPSISTVELAREYGVSYILEPHGAQGLAGTSFVTTLAGEDLYRVPNSGRATLAPIKPLFRRPLPPRVVRVVSPAPTSWLLSIDPTAPSVLHFALTDVPGWNATIDGKPLRLERFDGVMLKAIVPPGHHVVELSYWPKALTFGLLWAAASVISLAGALILPSVRRRLSRDKLKN